MLRVGLTGGIACGKSTVGNMFAERGVRVLRADEVAHQLMRPGEAVYEEVVKRFGQEVVSPDGSIDRRKLADIAFNHGRIQELNQLVHPAVISRQEEWMLEQTQADPFGIAMVEAALLLEAGVGARFDRLIVVTCRPEQKLERYAPRVGGDRDRAQQEIARRSAAQLSDEEKVKAAHHVIDNSGSLEQTRRQVESVLSELKQAAGPEAQEK